MRATTAEYARPSSLDRIVTGAGLAYLRPLAYDPEGSPIVLMLRGEQHAI